MLIQGLYLTWMLIFEDFFKTEMASSPCELCADSYGNRSNWKLSIQLLALDRQS